MTARDRSCIAKSPGRAHTGALAEVSPVPPGDWGVERVDPGIDAQAGDVPGEPPSRVFDMVLRGYDRHQVDEQIERLENRARQHRDQAQALRRELSVAQRQLREGERPAQAGLGLRIEQLLRLAEELAAEIRG